MILVALSLELTDIFQLYFLSKQISAWLFSFAWNESQIKKSLVGGLCFMSIYLLVLES